MSPDDKTRNDPDGNGHTQGEAKSSQESDTLGRFLKQMSDEEQADLAAAAELPDAVGLDRVEATLEQIWEAEPQSAPTPGDTANTAGTTPVEPSAPVASPRPSIPLRLLASAAALLLVLWWFADDTPKDAELPRGPGPGNVFLGARDGFTLRTDALATEGLLRWEHASPDGHRFLLRIRDPRLSGPSSVLLEATFEGHELQWSDAALVSTWTGLLVIDLDVLDDSSLPVDSIRAEVDLGH